MFEIIFYYIMYIKRLNQLQGLAIDLKHAISISNSLSFTPASQPKKASTIPTFVPLKLAIANTVGFQIAFTNVHVALIVVL